MALDYNIIGERLKKARIDKKLRRSLGINFNKTAIKMQKLGFCPDTAKEDWSIVFQNKE